MKLTSLGIAFAVLTLAGSLTVFGQALSVVKTGIVLNYRANISVGDSIIAYGTGVNNGVDYIKAGDTKGRGIPDSERFSSMHFVAVGDKIVLLAPNDFSYHVFDTKTGSIKAVPGLKNRGLSRMVASGPYVAMVTIDDAKNRNKFSVIDVSGAEPNVIVDQEPWRGAIRIDQVAIDSASGNLVVSTGDQVARVLFKTGDTEPIPFDLSDKGRVNTDPMAISGDKLYYFNAVSGTKDLMELDLSDGSVNKVGVNPATTTVVANGGTVAYFANRDAKDRNGTESRLAVIKRGGKPTIIVPTDKFVDGSTRNNGLHGFGSSIAITPDGRRVFIAGKDSIGRTERLQMYDGTMLRVFADAASRPAFLPASDVAAGPSLLGFKTGANSTTTLAYIRLR